MARSIEQKMQRRRARQGKRERLGVSKLPERREYNPFGVVDDLGVWQLGELLAEQERLLQERRRERERQRATRHRGTYTFRIVRTKSFKDYMKGMQS